jgi:hypothetical protein
MTPKTFNRVARKHGLTRKQLVNLSLCQSAIYHFIRFGDLEDTPTSEFDLADMDGRKYRSLLTLQDKGLVSIRAGKYLSVTPQGWRIPCNSGASIFIGGYDDNDVITGSSVEPVTRFGPRFDA